MERKSLEELGLEKEIVSKVLDMHSADIGDLKKQTDSLTTENGELKTQLKGVADKLEAFKGVDVEALRGEVETLKSDLAEKETAYTSKLAERDFTATLNEAVLAAKGKNAKAVVAMLDNLDALKTSKNQKDDIAAAIKALQESDAYLFESTNQKNATPAKVSTGGEHNEDGGDSISTNAQMNALITGQLKGE